MFGSSADTTNVMFGCNNSISRVKDAIPSCIVLKCVCHSTAFSFHASKTLPRNIDWLIQDMYNYFLQSAKQIVEFKEFQDFSHTKA